ncbi:MAG: N-acetyltransferase [Candidatus Heimdallarchaeota archaeon]|nr:N-acetyltransferase [Candidatus Heimdallarchaeota archaeon]
MKTNNWKIWKIQRANLNDLEAIYEIETLCFDSYDAFDKQVFRYLLEKDTLFLVAKIIENNEFQNGIVGFIVVLQKTDSRYEIVTLNVHPKWRNRGIGTSLLFEIEKYLKFNKIKGSITENQSVELSSKKFTIELMVLEKNEKAISLYKKSGYKFIKIIKNYYRRNRNGLQMVKEINFIP